MQKFITFIVWVTLLFPSVSFGGTIYGKVVSQRDGVLIIKTDLYERTYIAVTNYPGTNATYGRTIAVYGQRIGNYSYGHLPIELWEHSEEDRGKAIVTEQQRRAAAAAPPPIDADAKAFFERQKKAADEKRKKESEANTLKWLQSQAASGDDIAQCRLGEKYLKGDGVEKDVAKAREYLAKSAAQGNKTAQELLASIPEQ